MKRGNLIFAIDSSGEMGQHIMQSNQRVIDCKTEIILLTAMVLLLVVGLLLATAQCDNRLPKEILSEKDGATMRLIPAGEFKMGAAESKITRFLENLSEFGNGHRSKYDNEIPRHTVYLDDFFKSYHSLSGIWYLLSFNQRLNVYVSIISVVVTLPQKGKKIKKIRRLRAVLGK